MLISDLDGRVVGTVSTGGRGHVMPGSLRLFALDVGPEFRRRGVGTALVEAVERRARSEGLESVNLEVTLDNDRAIRLYEALGYRRTGRPEVVRWSRQAEDGGTEIVEEPSSIMIKKFSPDA